MITTHVAPMGACTGACTLLCVHTTKRAAPLSRFDDTNPAAEKQEFEDAILDDLKRVTLGHGIFTVHTQAAMKVLPDGRNAHLIQQPPEWWLPKIIERFELVVFNRMSMGFWVLVERKRPA